VVFLVDSPYPKVIEAVKGREKRGWRRRNESRRGESG
jgi:hypothetical protein